MIKFVIPLLAALFILLPVVITQTVYADPRDPIFCCVEPPEPKDPIGCCDPVDPPVDDEDPVTDDEHDDGDSYEPPVVDPPVRYIGICHATGSTSNPYVHIVVAEAAVPAHRGHPGDVIGVNTPDQCPPAIVPTPRPAIGICHATGNASNPYVHLIVEHKDRPQHDRHGQDIVGISNPNDCPKPVVVVGPPIIDPVIDPPVITPPVVVTEPPVVVVEPPVVVAPAPGIAAPPAQNVPTSVEQTVTSSVASVAMPDKVQAHKAATMPKVLPKAGDGDVAIHVWGAIASGLLALVLGMAVLRVRKEWRKRG